MSTPTFIRFLTRFTARRGTPELIIWDNALTFKAAERFLSKVSEGQMIKDFMDKKRMNWKFNLDSVHGKVAYSKGWKVVQKDA